MIVKERDGKKQWGESRRRECTEKRDVVAFEHDAAHRLRGALLHVHLGRVVKHHVHVLVKADDGALQTQHTVLVQPDLHARSLFGSFMQGDKREELRKQRHVETNIEKEPMDDVLRKHQKQKDVKTNKKWLCGRQ